MSEEKKKMSYYHDGEEKTAGEVRKETEDLIPYTPRDTPSDFNRLMNRIQRDFDDFWGISTKFGRDMSTKAMAAIPFAWVPSVDLEDRGNEYALTVDLPGFKKEDVQVEVTDDFVTVNANHRDAEDEKNKNYIRRERAAHTFCRKIQLPETVRSNETNAKLNDGILAITLPKKTPKESKKLEIT